MEYQIGESNFDIDLELVKEFYLCENTNDILANTSVYQYYVHKITMRWNEFVKNQKSSQYEEIFLKKVDEMERDFKSNGKINNNLIIDLFYFLAILNCGLPGGENFSIRNYSPSIFPLPNVNANIFYNTWVYSFFKGITLLRFPATNTIQGNKTLCPFDIASIDLNNKNILDDSRNDENFPFLEKVYEYILTSNMSKKEKEFYIFMLWVLIFKTRGAGIELQYDSSIFNFFYTNHRDIQKMIEEELLNYSSIFLTEQNIRDYSNVDLNYQFKYDPYELRLRSEGKPTNIDDLMEVKYMLEDFKNERNISSDKYIILAMLSLFKLIKSINLKN